MLSWLIRYVYISQVLFQLNRAYAFQWEYFRPRSSILPGGNRVWNIFMAELQVRFGIGNRQYFEKRFLPAYSTGFKVPETREGKKFLFFQNSFRRSLTHSIIFSIFCFRVTWPENKVRKNLPIDFEIGVLSFEWLYGWLYIARDLWNRLRRAWPTYRGKGRGTLATGKLVAWQT